MAYILENILRKTIIREEGKCENLWLRCGITYFLNSVLVPSGSYNELTQTLLFKKHKFILTVLKARSLKSIPLGPNQCIIMVSLLQRF